MRAAKKKVDDAKIVLGKIKSFIRSFDKAFDTAKSMEYRLGREMDKVMRTTGDRFPGLDAQIEDIIKGSSPENLDPLA